VFLLLLRTEPLYHKEKPATPRVAGGVDRKKAAAGTCDSVQTAAHRGGLMIKNLCRIIAKASFLDKVDKKAKKKALGFDPRALLAL